MSAKTKSTRNAAPHSRRPVGGHATFGAGAVVLGALLLAACGGEPSSQRLKEERLAPNELESAPVDPSQIGGAKVTGIVTRIVAGTPSEEGVYSILLFVPPDTEIKSHSHRDDRVGSVLSGTWYFAYGEQFAAGELEELKAGSVYTEPGGQAHFARTRAEPVVLSITGNGPTDTHYINPADDPKTKPEAQAQR
jgi:quercetin dioxygenase-like cupin family protein